MPVTVPSRLERRSTVYERALATVEDGLFIVLDDARVGEIFEFSSTGQAAGAWNANTDSRWSGGTEMAFAENDPDGALGDLVLFADGTQVSLVGRAPPTSAGHRVKVELDRKEGNDFALQDTADVSTSPSYRTWLTLDLPDTGPQPHYVYLRNVPKGVSLDYAVVKAAETTVVTGEVAIVDQGGKAVNFKGGWEERSGRLATANGVYYPYGGSVHAGQARGQTMDVSFVGSSISVYGTFPATNGSLYTTYIVDDGIPQPRTYDANTASSTLPNYLLFSQTGLSPGFHTLSLNILENSSDEFLAVDYITYQPTFGSIERLKGSEATLTSEVERQSKPQMSKGTVAGMVVGVIGVVALLVVCACMRQSCIRWARGTFTMRRRKKKGGDSEKDGVDPTTDPWSSQSPHYAFVDPNRTQDTGFTDTVSTLPVGSRP